MRVRNSPAPPVEPAPVGRELDTVDLCLELVTEQDRKNNLTGWLEERRAEVRAQKVAIAIIESGQIEKKALRRLQPIANLVGENLLRPEIFVADKTREERQRRIWRVRNRDILVDSRRRANGARYRCPHGVLVSGFP